MRHLALVLGSLTAAVVLAAGLAIAAWRGGFMLSGKQSVPEVQISGTWMKPVSERLAPCSDPADGAWGWSIDSNAVVRFDKGGNVVGEEWILPHAIVYASFSRDCHVAWFRLLEAPWFATITDDSHAVALAPESAFQKKVASWLVSSDGLNAWISIDDDYFVRLSRRDGALLAQTVKLPKGVKSIEDFYFADIGHSAWLNPNNKGFYLIKPDGSSVDYVELRGMTVALAVEHNDGHVAWVTDDAKGITPIGLDGRVLRPLRSVLPNVDVRKVLSSMRDETLWVTDERDNLFAARATPEDAKWKIETLNNGEPVRSAVGGAPIAIETWASAQDGTLWVVPKTKLSPKGLYDAVWRARVEVDGTISMQQAHRVPGRSGLFRLMSVMTDDRGVWVKSATDQLFHIAPEPGSAWEPLPLGTLHVDVIMAAQSADQWWLEATPQSYLLGPSRGSVHATVKLGDRELRETHTDSGRINLGTSKNILANVTMSWPGSDQLEKRGEAIVRVTLKSTDEANPNWQAAASGTLLRSTATVTLLNPIAAGVRSFALTLTGTHQDHPGVTISWAGLEEKRGLGEALWSSPIARAVLWLLIPAIFLALALRHTPAAREWAPLLVPIIETGVGKGWGAWVGFSPLDVLAAIALSTCGCFAVALLSGRVFRALCTVQPFSAIAPLVVQIGVVRQALYRGYRTALAARLVRVKANSNDERYVNLPAVVRASWSIDAEFEPGAVLSAPAEKISEFLGKSDVSERRVILLEAPGGRGKSALVHEIAARLLDQANTSSRAPLPLLIESRSRTCLERARMALGQHEISPVITHAELAAGRYVLLFDGATEAELELTELEEFVRLQFPQVALCFAMRPSKSHEELFDGVDGVVALEPLPLDTATLDPFLRAYGSEARIPRSRERRTREESPLRASAELKKIVESTCRGADGTFQPLLVRLTTLAVAAGKTPSSIAQLYEDSCQKLLHHFEGGESHGLAAAEEIALDSYWRGGVRVFAVEPAKWTTAEELLKCGLLVPRDGVRLVVGPETRPVRFFHDSVQSFLVARALSRDDAALDALFRAAGAPPFTSAAADLVPSGGSELFQMLLALTPDIGATTLHLRTQMLIWADQLGDLLSVHDVRSCVPHAALKQTLAIYTGNGAASILRLAIGVCAEHDLGTPPRWETAALFGRLAMQVWQLQEENSRGKETSANGRPARSRSVDEFAAHDPPLPSRRPA